MSDTRRCAACGAQIPSAALCTPCEDATGEILAELAGLVADYRGDLVPSLFAELAATAAKQSVMGRSEGKSKGAEVPLPYAADRNGAPRASAVAEELAAVVGRYADDYGRGDIAEARAEALRDVALFSATRNLRRDRARQLDTLRRIIRDHDRDIALLAHGPEGAAEWLLGRMDVIRINPTAGDMLRELRRQRGRALAVIDRPAEPVYLADCMASRDGDPCRTPLRGSVRDDTVTCWKCRTEHVVLDLLAARDSAIDEGLATVREIADAGFRLPWSGRRINEAMIKGYERRGRIVSHGMRHGLKLFRVGEVKKVAMDADRPRTA